MNVDHNAVRYIFNAEVVCSEISHPHDSSTTTIEETLMHVLERSTEFVTSQMKSTLSVPADVPISGMVGIGQSDFSLETRLGALADSSLFIDISV